MYVRVEDEESSTLSFQFPAAFAVRDRRNSLSLTNEAEGSN